MDNNITFPLDELKFSLDERQEFINEHDKEMKYICSSLNHYFEDVSHAISLGVSRSVVSHLTYNLVLTLSKGLTDLVIYEYIRGAFLLADDYDTTYEIWKSVYDSSKKILPLLQKLKEEEFFAEDNDISLKDFLNDINPLDNEEDQGEQLNLYRLIALNSSEGLVDTLIYFLRVMESLLADFKIGVYKDLEEQYDKIYSANYKLYKRDFWPKDGRDFRPHIENNIPHFEKLTPDYLAKLLWEEKKNYEKTSIGILWRDHFEDKKDLYLEVKNNNFNEEQWKFFFKNICRFEEYNRWIEELNNTAKSVKNKKQSKSGSKSQSQREIMTFKKKNSILREHLILLFNKLTQEGWIDGNEADFIALFSGKRDEECVLTWLKPFGKAALFALFKTLNDEGLISVSDGFALSSILEGHFQDASGQWLNGLDKGNKPNNKAKPVIDECVKLLQTDLQRLVNGYNQDDEDFQSVYDSYDHQDMHLHSR